MRILYFADVRFPIERANGIQTFETCYALAERGCEVTLLVRADRAAPRRDPFAFYARTPHPGLRVARVVNGPVPSRRALYLAVASAAAAGRWRHDILFTRDLGVAAAVLAWPRALRAPLVYESHGYAPAVSRSLPKLLTTAAAPSDRKLRRLRHRERRVWRDADGYVTITSALAAEMVGRFGPRRALAVIPDGVRLAADRTYAPPPPASPPVAAYAGHLYPWKGVDVLVDALARLPHVRGLIVGGHPDEPDLMRVQGRAAALGIADRITFTGLVAPGEVGTHLAQASVLVLPNTSTAISERYTSPLKLFEYLAAGRPIVASDLPAIREVVRHGEHAWLVPPGQAAALADGIAHVLGDAALGEHLARQAWMRAAEYAWTRRAARLELLLREAAATRTVEPAHVQ